MISRSEEARLKECRFMQDATHLDRMVALYHHTKDSFMACLLERNIRDAATRFRGNYNQEYYFSFARYDGRGT